jgi:hypothetical protein
LRLTAPQPPSSDLPLPDAVLGPAP